MINNSHPNISVLESSWNGVKIRYCQMTSIGDFALAMPPDEVSIAFAPHDRTIWSVDGGTRKTTPVTAGSVLIHADRDFVWHYREKRSEWLSISIEPEVLSRIAIESGLSDVELEYRVLFSDPTILNIAQLFKAEVVKSGVGQNFWFDLDRKPFTPLFSIMPDKIAIGMY